MKPRRLLLGLAADKVGSAKPRDPWWLGPVVFVVVLAAFAAALLWAVRVSASTDFHSLLTSAYPLIRDPGLNVVQNGSHQQGATWDRDRPVGERGRTQLPDAGAITLFNRPTIAALLPLSRRSVGLREACSGCWCFQPGEPPKTLEAQSGASFVPVAQATFAMILSNSASANSFSVVVRTFPFEASDRRYVARASSLAASTWMTRS
jgi:hypothetical protein